MTLLIHSSTNTPIKPCTHQYRHQIIHPLSFSPSFNHHTYNLCSKTLSHIYTSTRPSLCPSLHLFIYTVRLSRFLPEVQLVLVGLWNSGERVEV